ncbi:MAG: hypothetical protein FWE98_04265 [Oscillospiraceae bacterium]|nr:hypothetical protein [Oscillospiraceae bacterium]
MKKALAVLLALLLLGALAACGGGDSPTQAPTTEETTAEPESVDALTPTQPEGETSEEATTLEEASANPGETTAENAGEAALTPDKMNKEQLVAYYNDAINLVRTAKPAYTRTEVLKVDRFVPSIGGDTLEKLLSGLIKALMPGTPKITSKNKGQSNADDFYITQQNSEVRLSDLKDITAKKDGANYVITLTMSPEVNPAKLGTGKYSRVFFVSDVHDMLDELAGKGMTGDPKNITITYKDGKSVITVNEQGQIVKAHGELLVDVDAKRMKISLFTLDLLIYQASTWDYADFAY